MVNTTLIAAGIAGLAIGGIGVWIAQSKGWLPPFPYARAGLNRIPFRVPRVIKPTMMAKPAEEIPAHQVAMF